MATTEKEVDVTIQSDLNPNKAIVESALAQMNFSEAAKKLLLDPNSTPTDLDSIQSIALTQEHLSQVKKSLGAIVDSLQENPSLISRAAAFWGELPLWQRIIGGVVISGPTLVIGAAGHIGFLVTISGVSALAYTTSGIVLDDHHFHTKSIAQKLKAGIFGVAEILELTIGALDSIRKKLTIEVEKFKAENERLAFNISNLNEQVETLSTQVEIYVETEKLLRKSKEELELKAETLKKDVEKQSLLISANQEEITQVKDAHAKCLLLLTSKVSELTEVRASMAAEVEKAKKIAATLEGTVKTLSSAVIGDTSQRQAFHEKLSKFLADESKSFDQVAERISKAETELSEVKSELKASNERYKKLLLLQEEQIRRLEKLDQRVDISINPEQHIPAVEPVKNGGLLSAFGFLALPQLWSGGGTQQSAKQSTPEVTKTASM